MDKVAILNNSRMARLAYETLKDFSEASKKRLLARLLAETKVGPLDPQTYAKYLGGIEAIEDLESILKKEILKGEKIETEILNGKK